LYVPLIDPTILIIIIVVVAGGLALLCIAPIIILVTCVYYRRKKGDMKHSTSYDNLIPEEEPDIDEDMYKHLKEDEEIKKRGGVVGIDIKRRISQLESVGLVDELSPTKQDIAVTYIDDIDEDKEKEISSQEPGLSGEKKDITVTYIDTPEPDDKPENELKEKWKSAKRHSVDKKEDSFIAEEASDSDKTKLIQKLNDKKPGPITSNVAKPIDEDEKEDLSYIDEADDDIKPKKVRQSRQPLDIPKEGDKFKHGKVETDIQRRIRELQAKKSTARASDKKM
jgi:hypothetical protein